MAESLWGAIGLEQMPSRGSVTVGTLTDSGYTRKELNLSQDVGSAGENSTDSQGCSETRASGTVYSMDVSEGVA